MGMNRRSFFRKAATGAAVLAIAPTVLSEPFMPKTYTTYLMGQDAIVSEPEITGWVSYKYHMTVSLPPDRSQRIRFIEAA
jgi:hypothetical protein